MLRRPLEVRIEILIRSLCSRRIIVSVQTILGSVQSLVGGLKQVNEEIREVHKIRIPQDRFVTVMQASISSAYRYLTY